MATLVIKRTFDASPEDVFDAWIDPKQVAVWYGPEGFTNDIHEMSVEEGGTYHLTMNGPKGEKHPLRGIFKKLDRPNKLVMTWQWITPDGEGPETTVTVDFKDIGGKTEMTLTHTDLPSEESKEMHNQGFSSSFNKLAKLVE